MQWPKGMSKIILMTIMGNDMKADDMSTGTTIDTKGTEEEGDSSRITAYDHDDPPNALYVIKKGTDMQTFHTRTGLILNSVTIAE